MIIMIQRRDGFLQDTAVTLICEDGNWQSFNLNLFVTLQSNNSVINLSSGITELEDFESLMGAGIAVKKISIVIHSIL